MLAPDGKAAKDEKAAAQLRKYANKYEDGPVEILFKGKAGEEEPKGDDKGPPKRQSNASGGSIEEESNVEDHGPPRKQRKVRGGSVGDAAQETGGQVKAVPRKRAKPTRQKRVVAPVDAGPQGA